MSTLQSQLLQLTPDMKDVASRMRIGVVHSEWNNEITGALYDKCVETLQASGLHADNIFTLHVPGSFELPAGARILDKKYQPDAIICLGCVIKGDTMHDHYINEAVANGLVNLGIMLAKPVLFGVLTTENLQQALDRAGGSLGNKGEEAALSAIYMVYNTRQLDGDKKRIGF